MTRYRYYACGLESPHMKSRDLVLTESIDITGDATIDGNLDVSLDLTSASIPSISAVKIADNSTGPLTTGSVLASFTTPSGTKNIKTTILLDISFHSNSNDAGLFTLPFLVKEGATTVDTINIKQYMHDKNQHTSVCGMTAVALSPGTYHTIEYNGNGDIDIDANDVYSIMLTYLGYD